MNKNQKKFMQLITKFPRPLLLGLCLLQTVGTPVIHHQLGSSPSQPTHILSLSFSSSAAFAWVTSEDEDDLKQLPPLYRFASEGNLEALKIVMAEYGPNPAKKKQIVNRVVQAEFSDPYSITTMNTKLPLYYAVNKGHKDVVRYLIEQGADINAINFDKISMYNTYLGMAAARGDNEMVSLLLSLGAPIHGKFHSPIGQYGPDANLPPIKHAVANGHISTVELLLKHGANLNLRDDQGMNLIMYAVSDPFIDESREEKQIEMVKYLMGKGLDIKAKTKKNETALMLASFGNSKKIVKFLVEELGVDVTCKTKEGKTAMDYALFTGRGPFVELSDYLAKHGLPLDERQRQYLTRFQR